MAVILTLMDGRMNRPDPCPYCGGRVDRTDPASVYAVNENAPVPLGFDAAVDGVPGWFHPLCLPGASGYVRRQRPD
jgi:hypothetical protein